MPDRPLIVGLGGTNRESSSSEKALRLAMRAAERRGARTEVLAGAALDLPMYVPDTTARDPKATRLVTLLREADGVILSSPGYHGSVSGLLKNALDYIEDMRGDDRPYLHARAVGCIVCAYGWQATGTTLVAMRSIVHALRGWPTPLGIAINTAETGFDDAGDCRSREVARNLDLLGEQVIGFARMDWPDFGNVAPI
ncbi:MAG: NAD(P)H-dependent oxidoreductase [Rhodospirillaceae bacterium]|nr:NAD(P)H-dependent oxidoreductase [Rhodospirillaceae bacterium]